MCHNTSQLVVHATFHLLSDFLSETFTLDPTSMLLEPGQKQVDLCFYQSVFSSIMSVLSCLTFTN